MALDATYLPSIDPPGSLPAGLIDSIIHAESGGKATAKNPRSSAAGLGQFITGTWRRMIDEFRPDIAAQHSLEEIDAMRNDPALSREMTERYAEQNAAYLESRGIPITASSVYLAHFLGPSKAAFVLSRDPGAKLSILLPSGVIKANPFLSGMTVAGLSKWAGNAVSGSGSSTGGATITKASAAPQVSALQYALKSAGFSPGAIDGKLGPQTKAAIENFQRSAGIGVDGIAGPQTFAALAAAGGGAPGLNVAGNATGAFAQRPSGSATSPYPSDLPQSLAWDSRMYAPTLGEAWGASAVPGLSGAGFSSAANPFGPAPGSRVGVPAEVASAGASKVASGLLGSPRGVPTTAIHVPVGTGQMAPEPIPGPLSSVYPVTTARSAPLMTGLAGHPGKEADDMIAPRGVAAGQAIPSAQKLPTVIAGAAKKPAGAGLFGSLMGALPSLDTVKAATENALAQAKSAAISTFIGAGPVERAQIGGAAGPQSFWNAFNMGPGADYGPNIAMASLAAAKQQEEAKKTAAAIAAVLSSGRSTSASIGYTKPSGGSYQTYSNLGSAGTPGSNAYGAGVGGAQRLY